MLIQWKLKRPYLPQDASELGLHFRISASRAPLALQWLSARLQERLAHGQKAIVDAPEKGMADYDSG